MMGNAEMMPNDDPGIMINNGEGGTAEKEKMEKETEIAKRKQEEEGKRKQEEEEKKKEKEEEARKKEEDKRRKEKEEEERRQKAKEEQEKKEAEIKERQRQTKDLIEKLENIKNTFEKVKDKINLQNQESDDELSKSGLKTDFTTWFAETGHNPYNSYKHVKTFYNEGRGDIGASFLSILKKFIEKFEKNYKSILQKNGLI
ncbi:hypothetical protein [Mycoplasmopsis agalactiae]|uniref:hypothetical protein n=1 Tax=Mycoplasmopsis agalactiae TaxID=2110 RepID=UPI0002D8FED7|nr:hypothetical protein [Mycoplasmopsis agalactiae]